jgi:ABC-2 type transport system ATP-binding protein
VTAVRVRGLRKRYDSYEALRGIDFEIESGQVFGLLGPNGAGKTTTVEILEGYRPYDAGEVEVLAADPRTAGRAWRERIGVVLQHSQLWPNLTVRETLAMFAGYYAHPRDVDEVIAVVGLAEKRDARVKTLSGGQKRRVDLGLALVGDPELVFLDEPTTGFDPAARREAWNMIDGLRSLGKTIFLTTHYMDEAQHLADRVAIINAGAIAAEGTPDNLGGDRRTTISFHRPDGLALDELEAAVGARPALSGAEISIEVDDPQGTLLGLLRFAEERGIRLDDLEVRRASLEDVFLQLVGPGGAG